MLSKNQNLGIPISSADGKDRRDDVDLRRRQGLPSAYRHQMVAYPARRTSSNYAGSGTAGRLAMVATLPPTSGSACGWCAAPAFCDFGDAMNIKIRDLYEQQESKITGLRVGDCVRRPNGAELRIVAHGPGHNTVSSIYTSTWRGSQSTARDGRGFVDDLLAHQVDDLGLMDAEIIEAAPRG